MEKNYIRLVAIIIVSILVIITGAFYSLKALEEGDMPGAALGGIIALIILAFAIIVYVRGNSDMKNGLPIQDERSRRVMEKASSKAFYISLYLLLAVGFLSDEVIPFRDVSQATSITVGLMALVWAVLWAYYNNREI
jgi:uncharacterized membrane protein